jgi:tetratricopeptide (TPR) repeat protein
MSFVVTKRLLAALSLAVCVAVVIAVPAGCSEDSGKSAAERRLKQKRTKQRLSQQRKKRRSAVAVTAPAPKIPTSLPLVGTAGKRSDGYPRQVVDRLGLRTLLHHRRYADLTRYFEQYQAAFEKDPRKEYWPIDASSTFSSAEPELRKRLDAWVAHSPRSFAPYLARGAHLVSTGYAQRGAKWASKTAREDLGAMGKTMVAALADLDRALKLKPRLIAAMRLKISALLPIGRRAELRKVIDEAIARCRSCFQVRVTYLYAIRPRWGGSYEQMHRFAQHRIDRANPRHKLLAGYVALDKADRLRKAKDFKAALATIQKACALGEHWEFLLGRADIYDRSGKPELALADLDRAKKLEPGQPKVLSERAYMLLRLKRYEAAGRELLAAMRVAPSRSFVKRNRRHVVHGLLYQSAALHKAGQPASALRVVDLAAELAPMNTRVRQMRLWLVMQAKSAKRKAATAGQTKAGQTKAGQAKAGQSDADFRSLQKRDYALARQGRFDQVVQLWTRYLAKHPEHGQALLERGGAYFHLRQLDKALADATKACKLGVARGCARAKQVQRMTRARR